MNKYTDLTQEQKESITKELRELFEELIYNYYVEGKCLFDNDNNNWKSPEYLCLKREIKGFQDGEKLAIKIIDEEIRRLTTRIYFCEDDEDEPCHNCMFNKCRIEELKKQREHLEWESNLE